VGLRHCSVHRVAVRVVRYQTALVQAGLNVVPGTTCAPVLNMLVSQHRSWQANHHTFLDAVCAWRPNLP
jgi:hypothetical protein